MFPFEGRHRRQINLDGTALLCARDLRNELFREIFASRHGLF
jgi:hypothetical protein